MKAHQTDGDAEEGRVDRSDLHGNHQADVAANRAFWPRVRLPAPEPEPEAVESERPVRFPAGPF
eukprot:1934544-Amphidinium_carterae.1